MKCNVVATAAAMIITACISPTIQVAAVNSIRTAIVVLVSTDEYAISACVLSKTWRATKSILADTDFVALVPSSSSLSIDTLTWMQSEGLYKIVHPPAGIWDEKDIGGRPDLAKLAAPKMWTWHLIEYDRILYLDADSYALDYVNYFSNERYWRGNFTAVKEFDTSDGGFKGGQLAIKPSMMTYDGLMKSLLNSEKLANADQTFLNQYFHTEWHHKPQAERLPAENLLCSAYCVLAHYRPQYHDAYTRMLASAAMFDCQGKNKYWSMPPSNQISPPSCLKILPFVTFWLALAYAPDVPTVTKALSMFRRVEFDFSIMEICLQAALDRFMAGTISFKYYDTVQRVTEAMLKFPIFRNAELWGSKKSPAATTTQGATPHRIGEWKLAHEMDDDFDVPDEL